MLAIIVMRRILTGFFVFKFFKVKDDKKKEKKEDSEKTVRESIRKSLKDILTTRSVQLSVFCILEVLYVCKIPDYTLFRDVPHSFKGVHLGGNSDLKGSLYFLNSEVQPFYIIMRKGHPLFSLFLFFFFCLFFPSNSTAFFFREYNYVL